MAPEDVLNFSGRKRRPGKPKYRNPNDPEKTWTGRGKPPRWLKEMEDPRKAAGFRSDPDFHPPDQGRRGSVIINLATALLYR